MILFSHEKFFISFKRNESTFVCLLDPNGSKQNTFFCCVTMRLKHFIWNSAVRTRERCCILPVYSMNWFSQTEPRFRTQFPVFPWDPRCIDYLSHIMTKTTKWHVHPAKTQINLGVRPVWSVSSLSAWWNLGSLATHKPHSEDSDQTGRVPRLIWVFAGCTDHFVGFVMRRLIFRCFVW